MALVAIALVALGGGSAAPATAAPRPGDRVERKVRSTAPDARRVAESYVRIYDPLPASAGAHPPACDWLGYLRFRNRRGPRRASRADAVLVAMPGLIAGASSFDQVARNVVRRAARRHRNVEFWALDRRANCLEDHRGIRAAARGRDERIAFDYYFYDRPVGGRRFAGYKTPAEARFLSGFGLARTVEDYYTVVRRGMSRRLRQRKMLCGGHSLGGPITGAFAGWDFDGDPATTADAGYNQCAGFFGLDTDFDVGSPGGLPGGTLSALIANVSPYLNVAPLAPRQLSVLAPIGVAAYQRPNEESVIPEITPRTPDFELTERALYARDAVNFITGNPSVRDFRVTNETVLGATLDDNSSPITIFRSSVGTFDGGPVQQKDFPTPQDANEIPGLVPIAGILGGGRLMVPSEPHGPLYTWRSYRRVGAPDAPVQVDRRGRPFTEPASEVTSLHQLARAMFEAPADFTEWYFPTRLLGDVFAASNGDRSGDLERLRYDGVLKRPGLLVEAGDGIGGDTAAPEGGRISVVTLPGYDHLDVATAALRQTGGRTEGSSKALSDFVLRVAPRTRRR